MLKRLGARKKILIVSPVECYPAYYGNSARVASFYEQFLEEGHEVTFLHLPERPFNPAEMTAKLGNSYFYRPYRWLTSVRAIFIVKALKTLLSGAPNRKIRVDDFLSLRDIRFYKKVVSECKPDFVLINYTYLSRLFLFTPASVFKILDTHDSLFLRFKQLRGHGKPYQNLAITEEDEIGCLNRADLVVAIQGGDAEHFAGKGCTKPIETIGHILSFVPTPFTGEMNTLLYLASDFYINRLSLSAFLENIWPAIRLRFPAVKLVIAGNVADHFPQHLYPGVTCLGRVENRADLYASADIAINPLLAGSGLKIKNIEPLCFGKPVITGRIGMEGLSMFEEKGVWIADSIQEWTTALHFLFQHNGPRLTAQIGKEVKTYTENNRRKLAALIQ